MFLPCPSPKCSQCQKQSDSLREQLNRKCELNQESSPTPRCSLPAACEQVQHIYILLRMEFEHSDFRVKRLG